MATLTVLLVLLCVILVIIRQLASISHERFMHYVRRSIVVSIDNLTEKQHAEVVEFILDPGYQVDSKRKSKVHENGTVEMQYLFMPCSFYKEKMIVRLFVKFMVDAEELMDHHLQSDSIVTPYEPEGYLPLNVLTVKFGVDRKHLEEHGIKYLLGHLPFYVVCMVTPDKSSILSTAGKLPIMVTRKPSTYMEACHDFVDLLIERDIERAEEILDNTLNRM